MHTVKKVLAIFLATLFVFGSMSVLSSAFNYCCYEDDYYVYRENVFYPEYAPAYVKNIKLDREAGTISWKKPFGQKVAYYTFDSMCWEADFPVEGTTADISSYLDDPFGPRLCGIITAWDENDYELGSTTVCVAGDFDGYTYINRIDITLSKSFEELTLNDWQEYITIDTPNVFADGDEDWSMAEAAEHDSDSDIFMSEDEPFEIGKRYGFNLYFYAGEGYVFDSFTKIYVNGERVKLYEEEFDYSYSCVHYYATAGDNNVRHMFDIMRNMIIDFFRYISSMLNYSRPSKISDEPRVW